MCLGTGVYDEATGDPRTGPKCETCLGFGQFTDCPLCRGKGCWDCDGGMVAGP